MSAQDLEATHARLIEVADAWGRLAEKSEWFTRRIAEHLHATEWDPYDLTFADLVLRFAELGEPADVLGKLGEAVRQANSGQAASSGSTDPKADGSE